MSKNSTFLARKIRDLLENPFEPFIFIMPFGIRKIYIEEKMGIIKVHSRNENEEDLDVADLMSLEESLNYATTLAKAAGLSEFDDIVCNFSLPYLAEVSEEYEE
jgi:hypothetical protein